MGCCTTIMRYNTIKPEWEEAAREYIPAYIFYRNCRDGYGQPAREAFCTHCGEVWEVGKEESGHLAYTTWKLKHNEGTNCPQCDCCAVAKCDGRIHYFANLNSHVRMVFAEKIARDHVNLKAYYIEYYFENFQWRRPDMEFCLDVEYDLRPGEVSVKKWNQWDGTWEGVGIREPWPVIDGAYWNQTLMLYRADLSELAGTFLGYLPIEQISEWYWPRSGAYNINATPWCKLLCYAALYPQVEFVAKGGGTELIQDLVYHKKKNAAIVNWRGKNLAEFLRMPKADAKIIAQTGFDPDALKMRKKFGISAEKAVQYASRMFTAEGLEEGAGMRECNPVQLAEYLIRQGQGSGGIHVLRDYREAAARLGRDMTVELIRWPKNLQSAHDDVIDAVRAIEKEESVRAYAERYRELVGRYEFETDDYTVIVPERLEDIKREGADQHHCVAGYAGRHAEGKTVIVFIRRTLLRAVPLYTVELNPADGKIRQIQGYHNEYRNRPTEDAEEFVRLWQSEIARRLRKEKRQAEKNAREDAEMEAAAT